jgi:hypothetical protein
MVRGMGKMAAWTADLYSITCKAWLACLVRTRDVVLASWKRSRSTSSRFCNNC